MRLAPITTPPDAAELAGRLARVRALMAEHELDAYVSCDPINVYYLTHFFNFVHERPFVLVLRAGGTPRFVVPRLEEPHVRARAVCPLELVPYFEYPAPPGQGWDDRLNDLLTPRTRIGVEEAMPLRLYHRLVGHKMAVDLIDEVRLVKTPYEIGRLVHACQVMDEGYARLITRCRPGVAQSALSADVAGAMMRRILTDIPHANPLATSCKVIVQPPTASHDPHNFTDVAVTMEPGGPHVTLVVGQVNGYGVEHERTIFLDAVPDRARDPFDAMLAGRRRAFALCRPGVSMADIDAEVRAIYTGRGYGDAMLHRTGHGLGITGHEAPYLALGYDRPLAPGMVVSIEPGIYLPGVGGFRHSDTILITEEHNVSLTHAPETLDELTYRGDRRS